MPGRERKKSRTGIYHVMLRGINGQIIFEDREDTIKLLETIKSYREESGYEIYGYCLMNNHIHLLIKKGREDLGTVFRRIGAKYAYWYHWKYSRRGHLFQELGDSFEVLIEKGAKPIHRPKNVPWNQRTAYI